MRGVAITFYLVAAMTAASAILTVTARNILHAVLGLAGALLGAAGIFLLLGAEFVGLVQILVYIGAVVVLFLFGIMLTAGGSAHVGRDNDQRLAAAGVALGVFGVLALGIITAFGGTRMEFRHAFPTDDIGREIFTTWVLPFEAVSVLLLAALIGAIVLARRD